MAAMQLAIVPRAGLAIIEEFDLQVEASRDLDHPANDPAFAERVTSAHAPFDLPDTAYRNIPKLRAHIACHHAELRAISVAFVRDYIDAAHRRFPNLKLINMHAAPKRFPDPPVSPHLLPKGTPLRAAQPDDWMRLCESTRDLARHCAKLGLTLAVENNLAYWPGIDPATPADQVDQAQLPVYWCTAPVEWFQLHQDVNEPNLVACLDPSHATPFTHRNLYVDERRAELAQFLPSGPVGRIQKFGHLHWNDSDIETTAGRKDLHLCIGEGTLGKAFHAELKQWAVANNRVPLLEHFYTRDRLVKELDYIESL